MDGSYRESWKDFLPTNMHTTVQLQKPSEIKPSLIQLIWIIWLLSGPCGQELRTCPGTPCYMRSLEAIDEQCTCLPRSATTEDGRCYQPYTRGPCEYVNTVAKHLAIIFILQFEK